MSESGLGANLPVEKLQRKVNGVMAEEGANPQRLRGIELAGI